jgi:succinate dehydrogenase / fumarate reductase, membrane anchor subunit
MSMQAPLTRVRGLGSAKDGVGHWWAQRVTAIALVPLTIWFVFSVASLNGADYQAVRDWLASPLAATLSIALIVSVFYHGALGLQVVIEDYVHHRPTELFLLLAVKFAGFVCAAASILAVVKLFLGN